MNHLKNNKHAKKPADKLASTRIFVACTPAEKAKWVNKAQSKGMKLSEWVRANNNEKCGNE